MNHFYVIGIFVFQELATDSECSVGLKFGRVHIDLPKVKQITEHTFEGSCSCVGHVSIGWGAYRTPIRSVEHSGYNAHNVQVNKIAFIHKEKNV
jgi:hypothetical protein